MARCKSAMSCTTVVVPANNPVKVTESVLYIRRDGGACAASVAVRFRSPAVRPGCSAPETHGEQCHATAGASPTARDARDSLASTGRCCNGTPQATPRFRTGYWHRDATRVNAWRRSLALRLRARSTGGSGRMSCGSLGVRTRTMGVDVIVVRAQVSRLAAPHRPHPPLFRIRIVWCVDHQLARRPARSTARHGTARHGTARRARIQRLSRPPKGGAVHFLDCGEGTEAARRYIRR